MGWQDMKKKTKDPLVQKVIDRIARRADKGIKKYGNTMATSKKGYVEWINEVQEELGDAIVYLEKVKSLVGAKVKNHRHIDKDLGGGGGNYFNKWEGTDPE